MLAPELLLAWQYPSTASAIVLALVLTAALLVPFIIKEIRKGKVSLRPDTPMAPASRIRDIEEIRPTTTRMRSPIPTTSRTAGRRSPRQRTCRPLTSLLQERLGTTISSHASVRYDTAHPSLLRAARLLAARGAAGAALKKTCCRAKGDESSRGGKSSWLLATGCSCAPPNLDRSQNARSTCPQLHIHGESSCVISSHEESTTLDCDAQLGSQQSHLSSRLFFTPPWRPLNHRSVRLRLSPCSVRQPSLAQARPSSQATSASARGRQSPASWRRRQT